MKDGWKTLTGSIVRFIAMTVVSAVVFGLMRHEMVTGHNVMEGGLVESAQFVCVTLSGLVFLAAAWKSSDGRRILLLVAMTLFSMAVRELDKFFDQIFHGAWVIFVVPFALVFLYQCFCHFQEVVDSLSALLATPVGRMLEISTVFLLVFSRLIGTKRIWIYLCENEAIYRSAKNLVEEGTELFGYALFLVCAAEIFLQAFFHARCPNSSPSRATPCDLPMLKDS